MLGRQKMTHAGTAKVVSCQLHTGALAVSKTDSRGRSSSKFDLILDVFPEGASPFRAEAGEWFSTTRSPFPGDELRVRCNPEKQAVEVDLSEDARFNPKIFRSADEAKQKEERERILNSPPGTPGLTGDPELDELVRLDAEDRKRDA